jgi:hypothetical protein
MYHKYHASVFAKIYKVSMSCIRKTANNHGIKGSHYTVAEIVKMGYDDKVFYLNYIFPEGDCYPSRLNYTREHLLPNWLTN